MIGTPASRAGGGRLNHPALEALTAADVAAEPFFNFLKFLNLAVEFISISDSITRHVHTVHTLSCSYSGSTIVIATATYKTIPEPRKLDVITRKPVYTLVFDIAQNAPVSFKCIKTFSNMSNDRTLSTLN